MKQLLLLSLGIVLSVAGMCAQQQSLYMGVTGGYSFGVPLTVTRDPGIVNRYYGVELAGTSSDHLGWAGLSMRAPNFFSQSFGLSADVSLALSAGSFTSDAFAFDSLYSPAKVQFVHGIYTTELSTLLSMLQFDIQAQYKLSDRVAVGFGPWFTARLSSGIFQQEELVGTREGIPVDELGIADQERLRTIAAGKPLTSGVFRWGAMASMSYTVPLAQGMELTLMPHLRVDGPGLVDNLGVRAMRGGVSSALLFDVAGREPLPDSLEVRYLRDTVFIEKSTPVATQPQVQKPVLRASVQLYSRYNGKRAEEAVLRRVTTYYRQSSEVSPVVFFDSNSVALPERYNRLRREEAAVFTPRMFAPLTPLKAYYHVLNIIGLRMRDNPSARIALVGAVSEGEPRQLAQARCEAIAAYLRDVWGVDSSRVDIRPRPAADAGRSVSVASSSPDILAPFISEWKVRELEAPSIRLSHSVQAAAGVRQWSLILTHNGTRVGEHAGFSLQELDDLDLAVQISNIGDKRDPGSLHAELTVEDYIGDEVTSSADLPLVWEDSAVVAMHSDNNRESMSAVLFSSQKEAQPEANAVLNELLESVRSGAHVTIASLLRSDNSDEQRMLRPDRVAEAVLFALKSRNVQVAELHIQRQANDTPPVLRTLPESSLFRSAVCVTVEQNVSE